MPPTHQPNHYRSGSTSRKTGPAATILVYYSMDRVYCGDTWHETISDAYSTAEEAFGIRHEEWGPPKTTDPSEKPSLRIDQVPESADRRKGGWNFGQSRTNKSRARRGKSAPRPVNKCPTEIRVVLSTDLRRPTKKMPEITVRIIFWASHGFTVFPQRYSSPVGQRGSKLLRRECPTGMIYGAVGGLDGLPRSILTPELPPRIPSSVRHFQDARRAMPWNHLDFKNRPSAPRRGEGPRIMISPSDGRLPRKCSETRLRISAQDPQARESGAPPCSRPVLGTDPM